jgi:Fe-S cluster assembly protein SufD
MASIISKPGASIATSWADLHARLQFERLGREPRWLRSARKSAIAHFTEWGFPSTFHEEWRYTNLAPLNEWPCRLEEKLETDLEPEFFCDTDACYRLCFVNGHFVQSRSTWCATGPGLELTSLAWAANQHHSMVESHLTRQAAARENPMVALNTAFFTDGALIFIPAGLQVDKPIFIDHISDPTAPQGAVFPRHLIVAAAGSRATVIEVYSSRKQLPLLVNPVTEIVLGNGACLEHCRLQNEGLASYHVGAVHVRQDACSIWNSHVVSLGARLARLDIGDRFQGERGESLLNGLYMASDQQLVDHHTVIDHAQAHCSSHEFYHGILSGEGKGVFNGKIFVRPGAQKTDAKQTNRNLLLSDDATINTKPQLEIFADDVKCTHGATVGHLDDESLFYLRSRGIGLQNARVMLIHAFAREVIQRITVPSVRDVVARWLESKLQGMTGL